MIEFLIDLVLTILSIPVKGPKKIGTEIGLIGAKILSPFMKKSADNIFSEHSKVCEFFGLITIVLVPVSLVLVFAALAIYFL
ncbi:MAG: hypothetical protein ABIQ95_05455 [Bdellovibrionia bacterium]